MFNFFESASKNNLFKFTALAIIVIAMCLAIQPAFAAVILSGNGALGDFSGSLAYNPVSSTSASITISLTNTSPVANGGFLTAFVFNNPSNLITGITGTSFSDTDFELIALNNDNIGASPYGDFDLGSGLTGSFLGGGNPNSGIAVNQSETFIFYLTGNNLNALNELSFVNETSDGSNAFFLARFRGFENDGSDKVPGRTSSPEPASLTLLGLGLLGIWKFGKKGKKN